MTLTFRDFTFRAQHHLASKCGYAALPHWHTYSVRFWFYDAPDQDWLSAEMEKRYARLHGSSLNVILEGESSDEALARWFFADIQSVAACCRVRVTNDYQRGAEVTS